MFSLLKYLILFCGLFFVVNSASRVLELSDKFREVRHDGGFWLVKFYAPWCGHCRKLEPIWGQVAQALHKTNIRVGRVDCTRFPSLCSELSISGYPTIKFYKPGESFTYSGDRTKDALVDYAVRMAGPPVQEVTRPESLSNLKQMNQLFFMYVGLKEGALWDAFNHVADKLQPYGFFYSVDVDIARQHVDIEELPAVFVHKESVHYFYPLESGSIEYEAENLNASMYKWINEERFETFQKITRGNIHDIMQTKKLIVIAILQENKLHELPQDHVLFRDMVENVIRRKRDKYHKQFQFGWIGDSELGNSIAMQFLTLPHLLILNSTSQHHHIPEDEPQQLTLDAIDMFLEGVLNQTVPVYGGDTYAVRLYRAYFEAKTSLISMWNGNPVLTVVLFGLPFGFLCLILYSICCSDILDADDEEEESLLHEKKE